MGNSYFQFKQFTIYQSGSAMKVSTDSVLLGAWARVASTENFRVLDMGTGSGILAIMLAQRCTAAMVDAVEIEEGAYLQAVENVVQSPWANRISVFHQPLQHFAEKEGRLYDLAISNPPYFIQSLESPCQKRTTARHTASLSQAELIHAVLKVLKPCGRLALILPYNEGLSFTAKAEQLGLFCIRKASIKPNPSKPIKRLLLEFSRVKIELQEELFCIDSGVRHEYSDEYQNLTRDFYLKF